LFILRNNTTKIVCTPHVYTIEKTLTTHRPQKSNKAFYILKIFEAKLTDNKAVKFAKNIKKHF